MRGNAAIHSKPALCVDSDKKTTQKSNPFKMLFFLSNVVTSQSDHLGVRASSPIAISSYRGIE